MRPHPRLTAALLSLALCAASITPARAQEVAAPAPPAPLMVAGPALPLAPPPTPRSGGSPDDSALTGALIGVVAGFLAADVGFAIYDGVRAGAGAAPTRGVGIAEAAVASPQVVGFGAFHIMVSQKNGSDDGPETAALVFFPGFVDSLFVHGIWASQTPSVPPGALLGVSAAVGFDTALTGSILARAAGGHLSWRGMGVVQMVLTAPQIAASSYGLARDPRNAGGWAALTAWSGAIFTHGLVSAIAGGREPDRVYPPPPVPERPTLLVPASVHLGPVPMAGGGGIALGGQWL